MDLHSLRSEIDAIDADILTLLETRMEKALLVRRAKTATFDAQREQAVLSKLAARTSALITKRFILEVYKAIMTQSKQLQESGYSLCGFVGGHASIAQKALTAWDPSIMPIPFANRRTLFAALRAGFIDYCCLPSKPEYDNGPPLQFHAEAASTVQACIAFHPKAVQEKAQALYVSQAVSDHATILLHGCALQIKTCTDESVHAKALARSTRSTYGVLIAEDSLAAFGLEASTKPGHTQLSITSRFSVYTRGPKL